MTNLTDLFPKGYDTSDATVVAGDLPLDVIAYGASGRIVGAVPFSAVKLLLHMNGADTDTTFTDDSESAHVVTANGSAQLDTADKKFGTAAGLFDGTGDYLSIPYVAADFDWFDSDFTVEAWVKAASFADWDNAAGQSALIGRLDESGASVYWSFGPVGDGTLEFYYFNGTGQSLNSVATVPTDEWVHIAMSFVVGTGAIKLFINGVLDGSDTKSGTPQSVTYDLIIGQANNDSITGSVDDIRITKGYARYTANFNPPTVEYPDS